jgi:tRNA dimethylallyltransferase
MFLYLDGTYTLEEAIERMKGNTRRYCRKQLTWLKRDSRIRWFHPDDYEMILHHIDTQIQSHETAEMDMA